MMSSALCCSMKPGCRSMPRRQGICRHVTDETKVVPTVVRCVNATGQLNLPPLEEITRRVPSRFQKSRPAHVGCVAATSHGATCFRQLGRTIF